MDARPGPPDAVDSIRRWAGAGPRDEGWSAAGGGSSVRTAGWPWLPLAFLVAGQIAALSLIDAGRMIRYEHWLTPAAMWQGGRRWAVGILLLQALWVAGALHARRPMIRATLLRLTTPLQRMLLGGLLVSASAALSREPLAYVVELMTSTSVALLQLATVGLVVATLPVDRGPFARLVDRVRGSAHPDADTRAVPGLVWIAAALATGLAALFAVFAYQRHPHVPDEVVYLLHARTFADGRLFLPLPPVREAFDLDLMTYEATRWFSPVPPGWPAVLALGVLAGVPWLVNPILTGVNVLLAWRLLRHLYDAPTARLATLLLALSPWNLFLGMSWMTHTTTLTAALVAALAVQRVRRTGALWPTAPGGLALGYLGLNRPLEGLVIAVLLGFWTLRIDGRWRPVPAFLLAGLSAAAGTLGLLYNRALTGDPLRFPIMAYTDALYGARSNALGFGPDRGLGWSGLDPFPGHGLRDVVVNTALNVFQVNRELHGWLAGSLLLLGWFLVTARWTRSDRWMVAVLAAIPFAHAFYWFSGGPDFGARYWYLILLPCVVLTVRGAQALTTRLASDAPARGPHASPAPDLAGRRAVGALLLLATLTTTTFLPWRAWDKYHHYRRMRPDIRALAVSQGFGADLILVQGNRHPDYASAIVYNPLDLQAAVPIYAFDRDVETRRRVLEAYRDRNVWLVDGPTVTGDGYRVSRGPVPASTLLAELDERETPVSAPTAR